MNNRPWTKEEEANPELRLPEFKPSNKRRICFTLSNDDFEQLRNLLPHGTQDKLFAAIARSLIPMLQTRQREVLGGVLAGELIIELKLKLKNGDPT